MTPALARHAPRSEKEFAADLVMELAYREQEAARCEQQAMEIRCRPHVDMAAEREAMAKVREGRLHGERVKEIKRRLGMIS